jgi:hypothetical protein
MLMPLASIISPMDTSFWPELLLIEMDDWTKLPLGLSQVEAVSLF